MKASVLTIAWAIVLMVIFPAWAHAGMVLTDSGSGLSRTVTVESSGQFRLVFEAADNWGLSHWYDLVNDPTATTNLIGPALGVNQSDPTVAEPGLFQQVFSGTTPDDSKAFTMSADYYFPNNPRYFSILENGSGRVVLESTSNPMVSSQGVLTNVTNTVRYYIYPDGRIYINSTLSVVYPQTATEWRCAVLGLEDPTNTGAIALPDTTGWMRATDTQNPYSWSGNTAKYLFAYWNSTNSGVYNNWTKASILIVPNAGNPNISTQSHHEWVNFKRWFYTYYNLAMSANSSITQQYMIQLGTQGSTVLPNITSSTVADPIANAYLSNPTPPAPSTSTVDTQAPSVPSNLSSSNITSSGVTLSWNASTDNVGVAGYRVYRNGSQIADLPGTSYNDSNLGSGTTYTYTVAAYDGAGNVSAQSASLNVTTSIAVSSASTSTLTSLKAAILEYSTNTGATRSWIDSKFNWTIGGTVQPASTLKYMNYMDIYGPGAISELLALKDWAKANSFRYEDILLHASIDYTSAINPARTQMDKFDNFEGANGVLRTADDTTFTDLTATAYSGNVTWQNHMYLGYEEPFDQINLTFATYGSGVSKAWQYWNGSAWTALTVTDGTSNFTQAGRVSFTPPSTWTRTALNGSRNKYFVRCVIASATIYPATSSVKGDNWLNGSSTACRGWGSTDSHIVNSGELLYNPTPPAGASARFPYQARIPYWAGDHFVADPADIQSGIRTWSKYVAYVINNRVAASGYTGFMGDDGERDVASDGIASTNTDFANKTSNTWATEITNRYQDIVTYTHALNPAIKVGINAQTQSLVYLGDWNLAEYQTFVWKTNDIRGIPTTDSSTIMNYDNYLAANNPNGVTGVLIYQDTVDTVPVGGTTTTTWDRANRGPMAALSKHYIAMNDSTVFSYYTKGGYIYSDTDEVYLTNGTVLHQATDPIPSYTQVYRWGTYFPAMGVNVGTPDPNGYNGGARNLAWISGSSVGLQNDVWRRDFTNAIVIHCPASWNTTAAQYNAYSSPISLGGTYYPLYADGTIGAGITSISLRTGEGAILLKTSSSSSSTATTSDTTAPTASITSPAGGATVSGVASVTVAASDNVGVTKVELYVNGILQATDTASPYGFSWDTTTVANGSYSLTAKAYDAAGNVGQSAAVTVTVSNAVSDTTAPTVAITAPANNAAVSSTVTVSASATDNVGVSRVDFYLNGVLTASTNTAPYSFAWGTTAVANGTYNLSAKAYDAAGNVGQSGVVTVTVNNTAPAVSITSPANNSSLTSLKKVTINANATDNVAITKTELYIDGSLRTTATSGSLSWNWNLLKVASGQHTVTAKSYDAAGNVGSSSVTVYK